jgi:hypothetical protein
VGKRSQKTNPALFAKLRPNPTGNRHAAKILSGQMRRHGLRSMLRSKASYR